MGTWMPSQLGDSDKSSKFLLPKGLVGRWSHYSVWKSDSPNRVLKLSSGRPGVALGAEESPLGALLSYGHAKVARDGRGPASVSVRPTPTRSLRRLPPPRPR